MKIIIEVLRQKDRNSKPYIQTFEYETKNENCTVAEALEDINTLTLLDVKGNPVLPIEWQCSCLQKKCGACAMRINGKPALACDTVLTGNKVVLEPLRKFETICDLVVDRKPIYESLSQMKVYPDKDITLSDTTNETAQAASKCLLCGCCLEICPNYYAGGTFTGMAGFVPIARILNEETNLKLQKEYKKRVYEGCGKSLACRNICPAGIDIEHLLVKSNRMKRKGGK
ncbi:MAG: hypothetical protein J6E46_06375 [Faecalicoccus sp.]|nr:hypothetical protein [Faecalicoccus sp.]